MIVRKPSISIKESLQKAPEKSSGSQIQEESSGNQSPDHSSGSQLQESGTGLVAPSGVNPDEILKAWNDFASSIRESSPRVFSTLQSNRPVVRGDGTISLLLNSEAQRDNFMKNIRPDLARFICAATGLVSLEIQTDVVEGTPNGKKIYTDQDKLDFLIKKNPELEQLKSRFNLDFDD